MFLAFHKGVGSRPSVNYGALTTPILIALSSLAVGIACALVIRPIANSLNAMDVELSGMTILIIDRRWALPLFAILPFLLSILMMFITRFRLLIMIASMAVLLIPVGAVLHLFVTLLHAAYAVRSLT